MAESSYYQVSLAVPIITIVVVVVVVIVINHPSREVATRFLCELALGVSTDVGPVGRHISRISPSRRVRATFPSSLNVPTFPPLSFSRTHVRPFVCLFVSLFCDVHALVSRSPITGSLPSDGGTVAIFVVRDERASERANSRSRQTKRDGSCTPDMHPISYLSACVRTCMHWSHSRPAPTTGRRLG